MAKFCYICGSEMQDTDKFCNICGTSATVEAPAVTQAQQHPVTVQHEPVAASNVCIQQPVQQPAPPVTYGYAQPPVGYVQPPVAPPPEKDKAGLSVGGFFGFRLLFSLPFVGFIFIIIMSFAPRNKTLKNLARSYLLVYVIGLIIMLILLVLSLVFNVSLTDEFEDIVYNVI